MNQVSEWDKYSVGYWVGCNNDDGVPNIALTIMSGHADQIPACIFEELSPSYFAGLLHFRMGGTSVTHALFLKGQFAGLPQDVQKALITEHLVAKCPFDGMNPLETAMISENGTLDTLFDPVLWLEKDAKVFQAIKAYFARALEQNPDAQKTKQAHDAFLRCFNKWAQRQTLTQKRKVPYRIAL